MEQGNTPADAAIVDTPRLTVVGDGWVCIACEYSLRGLSSDGACPECGTAIGLSLRDDRLGHANPLWVMRFAQATKLLCFVGGLTWFLDLSLLVFVAHYNVPMLRDFPGAAQTLILPLNWVGCLLLGKPEYVMAGRYRNRVWGRAIQACATICLILRLFHFGAAMMFFTSLVTIGGDVLNWTYLRSLARRIPDRSLHMHVPFVLGASILMSLIGLMLEYSRSMFHLDLPTVSERAFILMMLVYVGYSTFILSQFSLRFSEAANAALNNYVAEDTTRFTQVEPSASARE